MKVTKEEYFSEFHVALRTALDSKASSLCWNAIFLLDDKVWDAFLGKLSLPLDKDVCMSAIDYGGYANNIFKIGLSLLTNKDYKTVSQWLQDTGDTYE